MQSLVVGCGIDGGDAWLGQAQIAEEGVHLLRRIEGADDELDSSRMVKGLAIDHAVLEGESLRIEPPLEGEGGPFLFQGA